MPLLEPDRYFSHVTHISVERDLLARGLTCVLLDVDNTILTRDTHEVPRDVGMWLGRAREAGVAFCLVSNNWHASVHALAGELDLPIVAKACKPSPHGLVLGMRKAGARRENAVMVGDQLMTDVLAAHLAGCKAYLLRPLVEQDLPHTLLMRNFENVILGELQPEPEPAPASCQQNCRQSEGKGA
ncbi:YqeG family HAD IIIA-type phosphatase [Adlercreutzia sp. ZJ242]|uniref:YqeG family HAD IIIA-type phosphatase n=1 Tax=Adlercreutzia sp. ZJ242 TaxID=2709409 RepID=UPI0013EAB31D|nr:YqeG family HAD IIIA-type phosphatase [Adlercreutzia sp. ZJ242]